MKVRFAVTAVVAAALAIGALGSASAQSQSLADLIANQGSITVGDKTFSNFTFVLSGVVGSPLGTSASGIQVSGVGSQAGNDIGLNFNGFFFAGAGEAADINIGYDVTVNDPNFQIDDILLTFNGAVTGTGFSNVTEQVTAIPSSGILGQASVDTTNIPTSLSAHVFLTKPLSVARVNKDFAFTGGANGTATVSLITQQLSQTGVPEPGTYAFAATSGIGGLLMLRRRKKA